MANFIGGECMIDPLPIVRSTYDGRHGIFRVSNGMADRPKMISAFSSNLCERMRVVMLLFIFKFPCDSKASR